MNKRLNIFQEKKGGFAPNSDFLSKIMPDTSIPYLDLFVRESLQNSLDAAKDESEVTVEFFNKKFNVDALCQLLEEASFDLSIRERDTFLAIRDNNTVGLDGGVDRSGDGNYFKLLFGIGDSRKREGSGGSWGLGKTIYYSIGVGLVLYYSRIMINGAYEERLTFSLVGKNIIQNKNASYIKDIAWWGIKKNDDWIYPLTDSDAIAETLSIFGIKPYLDAETGTTVIIPFVSDKELLDKTISIDDSGEYTTKYFENSVENYLKYSVQKWFSIRLNNRISGLPQLSVIINDRKLKNEIPLFEIIQELYNASINNEYEGNLTNGLEITPQFVKYKNDSDFLGKLMYVDVDEMILKMNPPYNYEDPYIYARIDNKDSSGNRPILAYVRKPCMVIGYEGNNKSDWMDVMTSTEEGKYRICLFVLNSNYTFQNTNITLEEYVRRTESASHGSWNDKHISGIIISKKPLAQIKRQVSQILREGLNPISSMTIDEKQTSYGAVYGQILFDNGYGKLPSIDKDSYDESSQHGTRNYTANKFRLTDTSYENGYMICKMHISIRKKCSVTISLLIDSEPKMDYEEWIDVNVNKFPFEITAIECERIKLDLNSNFDFKSSYELLEKSDVLMHASNKNGQTVSFKITNDSESTFDKQISMRIKVNDARYLLCIREDFGNNEK